MKIKLIFLTVFALLSSCANDFHSAGLPAAPFRVTGRGFSLSGQLGGGQKKAPQRSYASNSSSYSAPRTSSPSRTTSRSQPSANEQFMTGLVQAMIFGGGGSSESDPFDSYQGGAEGYVKQNRQRY